MEYQINAIDPSHEKAIVLANDNGDYRLVSSTADIDRRFIQKTMKDVVDEIHNNTLPGVRYLCNKCGWKADWTGQKGSLIWKMVYNTVNTVGSIVGLLLIPLSLGVDNQLASLLRKENVE
jgi:hypothetical protein